MSCEFCNDKGVKVEGISEECPECGSKGKKVEKKADRVRDLPEIIKYSSINQAAEKYNLPELGKGTTEVWFQKDPSLFYKKSYNANSLKDTHVRICLIKTSDKEEAYSLLQRDTYAPRGEADHLERTSMEEGDVLVIERTAYILGERIFEVLGDVDEEDKMGKVKDMKECSHCGGKGTVFDYDWNEVYREMQCPLCEGAEPDEEVGKQAGYEHSVDERVENFNRQLEQGTKEEMEHTNDPSEAHQIAMDHLEEDPQYYSKLEKCMKRANYEGAPDSVLEHWLYHYELWCKENDQGCEVETIEEMRGNESTIDHVLYHADIYAKKHGFELDGLEYDEESIDKEAAFLDDLVMKRGNVSEVGQKVLDILDEGPKTKEELVYATELDWIRLSQILTGLKASDLITMVHGGLISKAIKKSAIVLGDRVVMIDAPPYGDWVLYGDTDMTEGDIEDDEIAEFTDEGLMGESGTVAKVVEVEAGGPYALVSFDAGEEFWVGTQFLTLEEDADPSLTTKFDEDDLVFNGESVSQRGGKVIAPKGEGYEVIATGEVYDEIEEAIKAYSEYDQYFPNAWYQDDHGGMELMKIAKSYEETSYFEFLDSLRESGETNMWGAPNYLADEYGLDEDEASDMFQRWKAQFKKEGQDTLTPLVNTIADPLATALEVGQQIMTPEGLQGQVAEIIQNPTGENTLKIQDPAGAVTEVLESVVQKMAKEEEFLDEIQAMNWSDSPDPPPKRKPNRFSLDIDSDAYKLGHDTGVEVAEDLLSRGELNERIPGGELGKYRKEQGEQFVEDGILEDDYNTRSNYSRGWHEGYIEIFDNQDEEVGDLLSKEADILKDVQTGVSETVEGVSIEALKAAGFPDDIAVMVARLSTLMSNPGEAWKLLKDLASGKNVTGYFTEKTPTEAGEVAQFLIDNPQVLEALGTVGGQTKRSQTTKRLTMKKISNLPDPDIEWGPDGFPANDFEEGKMFAYNYPMLSGEDMLFKNQRVKSQLTYIEDNDEFIRGVNHYHEVNADIFQEQDEVVESGDLEQALDI